MGQFTIDFLNNGRVLEWEITADGAVATEHDDYIPCFYVATRNPETDLDLMALQSVYDQHPDIVTTKMITRRSGFRRDEEPVLAVDIARIDRITPLARQAHQLSDYPIGGVAYFDVDFSQEFRYCLGTDVSPTPASELSSLRLSVPVTEIGNDAYEKLSVASDAVAGSSAEILTAVKATLERHNPDALACSTSKIIPALHEMTADANVDDFSLSR